MKRRDLLKTATWSTAAAAMNQLLADLAAQEPVPPASRPCTAPSSLPRRPFGREGESLSIIGLGGIVLMGLTQEQADRAVAQAVERGVNYFDVAPSYGNGEAEIKLGPALQPYRRQSFLACKTTERGRDKGEAEFKRSLERLKTDHFDLYQLHAIADVKKDVDAVFTKGGLMDFLTQAKKEGRIRHLGFSAHTYEAAEAAMDRYDFESILFPLNFACWYKGEFGPRFVELARKKNANLLALKIGARQRWPENDPQRATYNKCWYQPITDAAELTLAVRFTLSQPITAAIPPGHLDLFQAIIEEACRFTPITEQEDKQVQTLAANLAPIFPHA